MEWKVYGSILVVDQKAGGNNLDYYETAYGSSISGYHLRNESSIVKTAI